VYVWCIQVKKPAKGPSGKGGVSGGAKKKKTTLKYTVDCTHPVEDGIMDCTSFVSFIYQFI